MSPGVAWRETCVYQTQLCKTLLARPYALSMPEPLPPHLQELSLSPATHRWCPHPHASPKMLDNPQEHGHVAADAEDDEDAENDDDDAGDDNDADHLSHDGLQQNVVDDDDAVDDDDDDDDGDDGGDYPFGA